MANEHIVTPADDLQAVINAAASGDVIRFEPGLYVMDCVNVFKRLTLVARAPHSAILQGVEVPPDKANEGKNEAAACALNLARRTADGTRIEGLQFQYFGIAIYVKGVADLVITGNRFVSNFGDGIALHDTADARIHHNEFLDPLLPGDPAGSVEPPWEGPPVGLVNAQMDYGVSIYGSLRPRVHHNYFFGVFNQTLSFKIANRDAYAGFNTFEGYNLTALFFGQESSTPESFPVFGASGWEGGNIVAEGNVFRAVHARHAGTQEEVQYRANAPVRVRFVDGDVTLRGNVVESGIGGIQIECLDALCPRGNVTLRNNLVVGRVRTLDGELHDIGRCAVSIDAGATLPVTLYQNTLAYHDVGLCAHGGVLDVANTEFYENRDADALPVPQSIDFGNHYPQHAALGAHSTALDPRWFATPDLRLRAAAPVMTPYSALVRAFHLGADAPGRDSGRDRDHKGAFPVWRVFRDGFEPRP